MNKISVVVPCFNEEEVLSVFYKKTSEVLNEIDGITYELLFVDDGSKDHTKDILRALSLKDDRCEFVSFSRNFGKEAAMFAGFRKLDNLVVIVDNNGLQIDGPVDQVCSPYPINEKFKAFNFHVVDLADGNDMDQIAAAFAEARNTKGQPTAIIAHTIKGKGVSFMENQVGWHGKAPNDEEYAIAMEDLKKEGEALCQK